MQRFQMQQLRPDAAKERKKDEEKENNWYPI